MTRPPPCPPTLLARLSRQATLAPASDPAAPNPARGPGSAAPAHPAGRRHWLALAGAAGAAGLLGGLSGCAAPGAAPAGTPTGAAASPPAPAALPPASVLPTEAELTAPVAPPAPRELRGAWVATVANIDWPSRPGLPAAQQRAEALSLLDKAAALGLNALVLQVRPAADALYPSTLEPWSEFLTGAQGRPPDDGYDPLAFWLAEAHKRGLQLHAWLNPYRARPSAAKGPLAPGHLAQRRPELVRRYGDQLWIDPAEPDAAAHTLAVVADLLQRYALDGLHIDDYFYPYPVNNAAGVEVPFPDDAPWLRYLQGGGTLERADWRRSQVDQLVQQMHQTVQRLRPGARFGVSPFGLPQPTLRPPGITGFSQYDKLYADVERWLREGWMDYLAPQLYWPIDRTAQAFEVLLDAWIGLNPRGVGMWVGLYTSMVGAAKSPWPADELLNQVARQRLRPAAAGHIHFSLVALAQDRDQLATRLRAGPYAQPALVPAFTPAGLPAAAHTPAAPLLLQAPGGAAAGSWLVVAQPGAPVHQWAIWRRVAGRWQFAVQPAAQRALAVAGADQLVVSAVSRLGLESPRRTLAL